MADSCKLAVLSVVRLSLLATAIKLSVKYPEAQVHLRSGNFSIVSLSCTKNFGETLSVSSGVSFHRDGMNLSRDTVQDLITTETFVTFTLSQDQEGHFYCAQGNNTSEEIKLACLWPQV